MKKNIFYILPIIAIGLLLILTYQLYSDKKELTQKNEKLESSYSRTYDYLNSITIDNFNKLVTDDGTILVYIGRPDCGDCQLFEPMFEKLITEKELGDKITYLNIKKFRENNVEEWNTFKSKFDFSQTPAIINIKDGIVLDKIEWNEKRGLSKKTLSNWLENQVIKS